jgi:hypothetical protein
MRAAVRSCTEPGSASEIHRGNPSGASTAWMLPPWVCALPEYHRSMTSPFTLRVGSMHRSPGMIFLSRLTCESPRLWPAPAPRPALGLAHRAAVLQDAVLADDPVAGHQRVGLGRERDGPAVAEELQRGRLQDDGQVPGGGRARACLRRGCARARQRRGRPGPQTQLGADRRVGRASTTSPAGGCGQTRAASTQCARSRPGTHRAHRGQQSPSLTCDHPRTAGQRGGLYYGVAAGCTAPA